MRLYSWLELFAARLRHGYRRAVGLRTTPRARRATSSLSFEKLEDRVLLAAPNPILLGNLNGLLTDPNGGTYTGTDGFSIPGLVAGGGGNRGDALGYIVANAGDVNGDGFDDLIIGAPYADVPDPANVGQFLNEAGQVFVIYGKDSFALDEPFDLNSLNGFNGFSINGLVAGGHLGKSVAGVGDVNNDGLQDIAIVAPDSNTGQGRGWVLFRAAADAITGAGVVNIAGMDGATDDTFGARGFRIEGFQNGANSGFSISAAGDVDGDGYADIIVGTPFYDANGTPNAEARHGHSTLIWGNLVGGNGSNGWFDHALVALNGPGKDGLTFQVSNVALPTAGEAFDLLGFAVSGIGDINGDGRADLAVTAPQGEIPGGDDNHGQIYVIFGNERGSIPTSTGAINGVNGFRLDGIEIGDYAGASISRAGDINGDGYDDFIIGALGANRGTNADAGEAYVIFGRSDFSLVGHPFDLSTLDGQVGFRLVGETAYSLAGWSVSGGGDIDGDGFDDLIVSAPGFNYGTGRTYVIFGRKTGFDPRVNLETLDGSIGFKIDGVSNYSYSGQSVSNAGDINGDGFDDLIIGAPGLLRPFPYGSSFATSAGTAYVVFGGNYRPKPGSQVGQQGIGGTQDTLDAGSNPANTDVLIGGLLNDVLISDGGPDVLRGGQGNDTLQIVDASFFLPVSGLDGHPTSTRRLQGGLGNDTVEIIGQGVTLDLTQISDNRITGIEGFDIRGGNSSLIGANNTLILNPLEVRNLSGTANTITVRRGISDQVILQGNWTQLYDTVDNDPLSLTYGVTFEVYVSGTARVLIEDPAVLNLNQVNGSNPTDPAGIPGFILWGATTNDYSGISVSGVGDVNGDGFDDLLVGAWGFDPSSKQQAGAAYLVFGTATPFAATFDLADLVNNINGQNAVRLDGVTAEDRTGFAVSGLGDVNGDGLDDFIISAHLADPNGHLDSGAAYVVFGKADWSSTPTFDLATLDGSNGFKLNGHAPGDWAGYSVSGAGDINGDGYNDILVSAYRGEPGPDIAPADTREGLVYVVFGKASGFAASIDLHNLDGTNGFRIEGINDSDLTGRSVSTAGDFNGDGFADILIGVRGGDSGANLLTNEGKAYVIFGKTSWSATPVISLSSIDGTNGVRFNGVNVLDWAGWAVSDAGDVNGDGFDDIIIGAYRADAGGYSVNNAFADAGRAYIVFGKANWSAAGTAGVDLSTIDGTNGFIVNGFRANDYAGWAVSSAGDVNGDGFDDILIGARRAEAHVNGINNNSPPNGRPDSTGQGYLVFGKADWTATPVFLPNLIDGTNGIRIDGAGFNRGPIGSQGQQGFDYATRSLRAAGDINGDGFADFIVSSYKQNILTVEGVASSRLLAGETYVIFGGHYLGGAQPVRGTDPTNPETLNATLGPNQADLLVGGLGRDTLVSDGGDDVLIGGSGDDTFTLLDAIFSGYRRIQGGNGTDTLMLGAVGGVTLDLTQIPDNRIQDIEVIDIRGQGGNTLVFNAREILNLSTHSNTVTIFQDRDDTLVMGTGWTPVAVAEWDPTLGIFFDVYAQGAARVRLQSTAVIINGNVADVWGTNSNDLFAYNAATNILTVNGISYDLNLPGGITLVQADGRGGDDGLVLTGTPGDDTLILGTGGTVSFDFNPGHPGFDFLGTSIEQATLDGGAGTDTLQFTGAGISLNLNTVPGNATKNVEIIDITGTGNNTLTLSPGAALANGANPLVVLRDAGDVVNVGNGWTKNPNAYFDGTSYFEEYSLGAQVLRVQSPAVAISGTTAFVYGTIQNDIFVFDAQAGTIDVNGTIYTLPGTVTLTALDAKGGNDQLTLLGTAGNDRAVFSGTNVNFDFNPGHAGFDLSAANVEKFSFDGRGQAGGMGDSAVLNGSPGDDLFTANPFAATLVGPGINYSVTNVEQITATAGPGGLDRALMYDSAGNDILSASPTVANMSGLGYFNQAQGFDRVTAQSMNGGSDTAFLLDSPGNDVFQASLATNIATLTGTGFVNSAQGFQVVAAQTASPLGGPGGQDIAYLTDSAGNDTFVSRYNVSFLRAPNGRTHQTEGFEVVTATSSNGGFDQAFLYDSAGDDTFTGTLQVSKIEPTPGSGGVAYMRSAVGFGVVAGRSSSGGSDKAILFDTAEQNVVSMGPLVTNFGRPSGLYLQAQGFAYVSARSQQGGNDTVILTGSDGNDSFIGNSHVGTMIGPGAVPQYTLEAVGFRVVQARGGNGIDVAKLYDTAGDDTLNASGTRKVATLSGAGYQLDAIDFKQVFAYASAGNDSATLVDSPGNDLFFARLMDGYLQGTGYYFGVSKFGTVSILGVTGGVNTLDARNLQFTLNVISNWTTV